MRERICGRRWGNESQLSVVSNERERINTEGAENTEGTEKRRVRKDSDVPTQFG
jgi:hypothetical protein